MTFLARVILDYPFGRGSLLLRLFFSSSMLVFYFYLAFQTAEEFFHLGFIVSFVGYFLFSFLFRRWKLRQAFKEVLKRGEYKEVRRGGFYELAYYSLMFFAPFFFFTFLDPVFAFGCLMGLSSSLGLSDLIFYLYVRNLEDEFKVNLRAFVEPSEKRGYYIWGLMAE